jgi:hypothetical protein
MLKTVLKEMIIVLLLCVAILLILSILFYDYNPINKVVPNKIAYTTPENIRNELEEESVEDNVSIENKVYTIDGSDLNIYKKSNSYNQSKQNPFASTTSEDSNIVDTPESTVKTDAQQNVQTTNVQTTNTQTTNTVATNGVKTNTSSSQNTGLK